MKKIVVLFAILSIVSCSMENFIKNRAISYAEQAYNNLGNLIRYHVDTVTIGDNLNYRIEQAEGHVKFAEELLEYDERSAREFAGYGFAKDEEDLEKSRRNVQREKGRLAALDSLRDALPQEELNKIAAFTCSLTYNTPGNIVWVQVDPVGNLIQVTMDRGKVFFNPGLDAPGYFEINDRFREDFSK